MKSFYLVETTLESFSRTERNVNNAIVRKAYRKIKGEPILKKENVTGKTKLGAYLSKRTFFPPLENSKFNLTPLIDYEGEFKLHPLFEPLAELLRLLYRTKIFDQGSHSDKIEYRLLEAIIIKARKHPKIKDLAELFPDDPLLCNIYYKILKGTNQYNREEGIPPLGDFVALDKDTHAISLSFASPLLLEALFGSEVASHILHEERKKWEASNKYYYYSKEDLQSDLMKNPTQASKFSSLESYLDYSKTLKPRNNFGGKDQRTGLSIKKPIY
jgi:hypothetical protein